MDIVNTLFTTFLDILPILAIIFGFQYLVIRKKVPNLRIVLIGFLLVFIGMVLFLQGLNMALFPLGEIMAGQLTSPEFIGSANLAEAHWTEFYWVYLFAIAIGFSTTFAEPSLLAVAKKAEEVSGGALKSNGIRFAVSIGVAFGLGLGTFRIVTGTDLYLYIIFVYVVIMIQTFFSSKQIIGIAYDIGGVTTSTVTVPLVAALGLGLATNIPGRSVLLDGFGLIAFAAVFPIFSVLTYSRLIDTMHKFRLKQANNI